MTTAKAILRIYGGLDYLREHTIDVRVAGYPTLTIEYLGDCNGGWPMLSVAHHGDSFTQVEYAIDPDGTWLPLAYRRDGRELLAGFTRQEDQRLVCWPAVQQEINGYLRLWSNELGDRGYVKAARIQAKHPNN
jgi:hypothetical protein